MSDLLLGGAIGLLLLASGRTQAQTDGAANPAAPTSPAPAINFRERPKYPTELQRLRRTVQIDGVLSDNEWDAFYTITEGAVKGVVYCNWDDNFLYLAARTDAPAAVLFDVDANGDGWLRGADNLEIVVGSAPESGAPTVMARLLDAANSKDTPSWNEKALDSKTFQVAAKSVNGTQVIELAIPKNTAGLSPRTGLTIGVRAEFLPAAPASAYTPTQAFEPHLLLDARLVDSRIEGIPGINPRLTLSDYKCVAGQTLFATLDLLNQTDAAIQFKSVTWGGAGTSANAVNMLREVTVPVLQPLKTLKLRYKTLLPDTLPNGTYTLSAIAEVDANKQAQSTVTFTVVEPVVATLTSEPEPVAVSGPTKLKLNLEIFSAVPRSFHGDCELTVVPAGWELSGGKKRSVAIDREDAKTVKTFELKLPSTTPAGDYPCEATVTWHNRVWKQRCIVHVVRTDAPKPASPANP